MANMSTAMHPADWPTVEAATRPWPHELPPRAIPADGHVDHRPEPEPGFRCSCGSLTLAATFYGQSLYPAGTHDPVVDSVSAQDPATDPAYLERYAACDIVTWNALLARTDLTEKTVGWLIRQACGWPDYGFASQDSLYKSLVRARPTLSESQLIALCGGDGPPSLDGVRALLGHPNAGVRVVCAVAGAVMSSWGGPRFDGNAGNRQKAMIEALANDPDPRVATCFTVRRAGLRWWHADWDTVGQYLRGARQAHKNFTAAMVRIDAHGPAGWEVATKLVASRPGPGGAGLAALVDGILAPPTPTLAR